MNPPLAANSRLMPAKGSVLLGLFVAYLSSPKIDLFQVGDASVRPEDIISLVAGLLLAAGWLEGSRVANPGPVARAYLPFLAASVVTSLLAFRTGSATLLLFGIRPLQYFLWAFVGAEVGRSVEWTKIQKYLRRSITLIVTWGLLEWLGLIPKVGRFASESSRISINTSGPFEASVVAAFLLSIASSRRLQALLVLILLLTQARSTLVAIPIAWGLIRLRQRGGFSIVGPIVAILLLWATASQFAPSRLADTPSPATMVEISRQRWDEVQPVESLDEYKLESDFRGRLADKVNFDEYLSFDIRAVRWSIVLKSTTADVEGLFFGWGPGAFGLALDNSYVRIFGESGLLGATLFAYFLAQAFRRQNSYSAGFYLACILTFVGLLIDIFFSSRAMPLFWLIVGIEHTTARSLAWWHHPGRTTNPSRAHPERGPTLDHVI